MTKQIPISGKRGSGRFATVDDEDYEALSRYGWHLKAGYAARNDGGRLVYMHRHIMDTPSGQVTDHINGDRLDNRRCNLRSCLHAQNRQNQKVYSNNTSGYRGVSMCRTTRTWTAQVTANGKRWRMCGFKTAADASAAYENAARESFGSFYRPLTTNQEAVNARDY
jgi:hypothetical protein